MLTLYPVCFLSRGPVAVTRRGLPLPSRGLSLNAGVLLGLLAFLPAQPVNGAEAAPDPLLLEEILVTGEFRPVDLSRTPSSISVIGPEEIGLRGAQHLEAVTGVVPNLNASSGASRARYYQIRGIGERSQFEEPMNSSVGLLVDGVDFSGFGGTASLFDVSQVEVFRGPQGTRYGANALAGLINIQTNAPTERFESGLRVEAGNYDSYGIGGTLSGPLTETLSARLAANYYSSDGYSDNDFTGDHTNDRDELLVRGRLSWQLSETTELTGLLGRVEIDNGYDAFSLDNGRDTLSDEPGHDRHNATFGTLGVNWSGAESYRLEALATYAESDISYGYDEDWVYVGFDPDGYSSFDSYDRDRRIATFEARVASQPEGLLFNATTDWAVGVYLLDSKVDLTRRYTYLAGPFRSDYEVRRYALFAQSETALSERVTLTLGGRYEYHESDYDDSNAVGFKPDDDLWGGRVAVDYFVTDAVMLYAAVARGYKAGGFNTLGSLEENLREYDPEELYNFEAGLKGGWFDQRLRGRLSGFYMWRDDMQVESSLVRPRPDGSEEFIQFVGNASDGSNYGLELEVEYQPVAQLLLTGNLGLLRTEYDGYVNAAGDDLDGRDQAQAPKYQFFLAAEYRFGGGVFARAELEGRDSYYYSDNHDQRSDAYELVNLAAGIEREQWSVTAWGRNVTDKEYYVRGFFFGNDPRDGYAPKLYTQLGEPAVYGVTLQWNL